MSLRPLANTVICYNRSALIIPREVRIPSSRPGIRSFILQLDLDYNITAAGRHRHCVWGTVKLKSPSYQLMTVRELIILKVTVPTS